MHVLVRLPNMKWMSDPFNCALTDTGIKETVFVGVLPRSDVVNRARSYTKTNGDIQKKIKGG